MITALEHEFVPAANFNERAGVDVPDILLMHYTGVPTEDFALEILTSGEREVSCHYMVRENGVIIQMVSEDKRAWHAGQSSWEGVRDINSRSIGIEICNPGHGDDYHDFPDAQIEAVIALSQDILSRHPIKPQHVLGHSDVAPGRKVDPGEKFPWKKLADAGVGLWVEPENEATCPAMKPGEKGDQVSVLQSTLRDFGYGIDVTGEYDERTVAVVHSFQMHFHQSCCDGNADAETIGRLSDLHSCLRSA